MISNLCNLINCHKTWRSNNHFLCLFPRTAAEEVHRNSSLLLLCQTQVTQHGSCGVWRKPKASSGQPTDPGESQRIRDQSPATSGESWQHNSSPVAIFILPRLIAPLQSQRKWRLWQPNAYPPAPRFIWWPRGRIWTKWGWRIRILSRVSLLQCTLAESHVRQPKKLPA